MSSIDIADIATIRVENNGENSFGSFCKSYFSPILSRPALPPVPENLTLLSVGSKRPETSVKLCLDAQQDNLMDQRVFERWVMPGIESHRIDTQLILARGISFEKWNPAFSRSTSHAG